MKVNQQFRIVHPMRLMILIQLVEPSFIGIVHQFIHSGHFVPSSRLLMNLKDDEYYALMRISSSLPWFICFLNWDLHRICIKNDFLLSLIYLYKINIFLIFLKNFNNYLFIFNNYNYLIISINN